MNILLLSNEYPPYVTSGQGVHVEYLSKELIKSAKVEIRTFHDQNINQGNLRVIGYNSQNKNYKDCPLDMKTPLEAFASCVDFNAINPICSDLVHCHTTDTFFGGILAKLFYNIPLILTIHSLEIKRPWRKKYFGATYDLYLKIERDAIIAADRIIAVSTSVKEDILKMYPEISSKKIEIIYNGIDVDEYKNTVDTAVLEKYGIDKNRPYVLFMGALSRQKGLQYLLKASEFFDDGVQLVICSAKSESDDELKEAKTEIERINQNRPNTCIFVDKKVTRKEAINLYSSAEVFCCPSIYEPFGIINLESMACSTPVVASSIGGIREVVMQGEGGFLVEPGLSPEPPYEPFDVDGFSKRMSDAINRLIKDKHLRHRMGLRGRERVENVFSWEQVAAKTLKLYKEVLTK